MKNDRIRVGLIGANPDRGWAMGVHIPALQALPHFEMTAVGTTRQETAEAAANKWGVRGAYTDPRQLAADPDVDLVVVSVKTPGHHALVRTALEAGKHVLCEWPLAATMDEVRDLVGLARAQPGVRTFIGLQARGAPVLAYAKDLVAQGYVGRVLSSTMLSASGWGAFTDQSRIYGADKKNGATVLSVDGGHTLDALCFVLGEFREVTDLVATQRTTITVIETGATLPKTSPDQVLIAGSLESGAVVSAHIQSGVLHAQGVRFTIHGTEGDLVISASGPHIIEMADLRLQGAQGKSAGPLAPGKPLEDLQVPASYRLVPPQVPTGFVFNVAQLYALVAADIRDGTSHAPDFELALKRHTLLDAVQRASDTGKRQTL